MSITVGIHDGHNASAAVIRDGRIELALQEERLTRVKNQGDAPSEVLKLIGETPARVALNGLYMNYGQWQRETILEDYARSSRWKQPLKGTFIDRAYQLRKAAVRESALSKLGLKNVEAVEHHTAHAAAALHTCPWDRPLVFTCDGSGDRLSATVSIGSQRIAAISEQDSIGRLYAMVTRYLGMASARTRRQNDGFSALRWDRRKGRACSTHVSRSIRVSRSSMDAPTRRSFNVRRT